MDYKYHMEKDNVKYVENNYKILIENGMKNLEHLEDLIYETKDPRIIKTWAEVAAPVSAIAEKLLKLETQKVKLFLDDDKPKDLKTDKTLSMTTKELLSMLEEEERKGKS